MTNIIPHVISSQAQNYIRPTTIENASGSVALNCNYNMFDITQTGSITFSFSNVPQAGILEVHIERTGAHVDTWPANVTTGDGVLPAQSVGPGLMDIYTLTTSRAGVPWVIQPYALGVPLL